MKPSFVFFDLDNTLLDHSRAEAAAQKKTYDTFSELHDVTLNEWLDKYRVINHDLWEKYQRAEIDRHYLQRSRFADTMKVLNLNSEKSEEIGSAYMEFYRSYWKWVDGAKNTLAKVSNNFNTGIITNGFKETQQLKIKELKLDVYCSEFLISEDVGKMKPHPAVFDRATELAGVSRQEILYVGDSYSSDILGGKKAGWQTAWFTGLLSEKEQTDEADIQFDDFEVLLNYLNLE